MPLPRISALDVGGRDAAGRRTAARRGCAPRTDESTRAARRSTARRRCRRRAPACSAAASASASTAVDGCVPLISASPSFAPSGTGCQPGALASASAPCDSAHVVRSSPRPRRSAPARGGRAAPGRRWRRPSRATARRDARRALSSASSASSVSTRMPENPFASTFARSAIVARTVRAGSGSPRPAAWLRSRLSCSASSASGAILTSANDPNPVLMP